MAISSTSSPLVQPAGHFALVGGSADAGGSPSNTQSDAITFVGGGLSAGAAGNTSLAFGTPTTAPHASANTYGLTGGGDISTESNGTMSVDVPFGAPVAAATSLTFVSAYYDAGIAPAHLTPHDEFSTIANTAFNHIA